MKYLVLIGDGMADHPLNELQGRTPLQAAHTPGLDRMAALGCVGQYCPIPEGLPPGSDVGNLSLFGYDPRQVFSGRAPIEAANQGIKLAANEVAFRCNFVTLEEGKMRDFTAGHISTDEARLLIATLNEVFSSEFSVTLYTGVSYRHLAIIPGTEKVSDADLAALECEPPHNITDQPYEGYLPKGDSNAFIRAMMTRSQEILRDHPVNQDRIARGLSPATSVWLWGQGRAPQMDTFLNRHGRTGAVTSAVDLVKGIGVCAGLEVLNVPGATGWLDTDYEGKVSAAFGALTRSDVAFIHVEAPDETAHQGRIDLKIEAIEAYDKRVVTPCLAYQAEHPDTRILAAPDHFTLISTKTHAGGPVPFVICGPGIAHNGYDAYSEETAAASGIVIREGHRLTQQFLRDETVAL